MSESLLVSVGLLTPFFGTLLGAAFVFFLRRSPGDALRAALLGFASGVMIAASVWSLLIPAIEMAGGWVPAAVGLLLGMGFLLLLDRVIPHLHPAHSLPEGRAAGLGKSAMLILAVTLHNLPEGMAVGAVFAGALRSLS